MKLKLNPGKNDMPEPKLLGKGGAPHYYGRHAVWNAACYHGFLKIVFWLIYDYLIHHLPHASEYRCVQIKRRIWRLKLKKSDYENHLKRVKKYHRLNKLKQKA